MKAKRAISTLLILASLLAAASCGSTQSDNTTDTTGGETTSAPETTRDYPEIRPEMNYDGYEFRIIGCEGVYGTHNDYVIEDGEDTSDIISDAIYRRNSKVEDLLGIKITARWGQEIRNTVLNSVNAGDDEFDLVFLPGGEIAASVSDGIYNELLGIDNVDWSKPWYDQSFISATSVSGKLFFMDSAISTQSANETSAIFCNKTLAEKYQLGDLYSLVRDGKWTMDKLYDFYTLADSDLDGDGKINEETDQYRLGGNKGISYIFFKGMGGDFIRSEKDGLKLVFGEEANISRMTDVLTRFSPNTILFEKKNYANKKAFSDRRLLFFVYALGSINWMRDLSFDFAILPIPKQNEEQEDYRCNVNCWGNSFMCLPKTVSDVERSSSIADVLSAESYYVLRDAYVENAIKYKYSQSENDTEMINLILDSRVYDIAVLYDIGELKSTFQTMFSSSGNQVASAYASIKDKVANSIPEYENLN